MAIPRSLGNELFRYRRRKRRPLDGSVPGLPQERFHRSRRYVSGMPYIPRPRGSHHDLYNWGLPSEYHPNVHAPAVQIDEYFNDPDWESHDIQHSHQDKLLRPCPELEPVERPFDYEHARAMDEFFLNALDVQYQHFEEGREVPSLADIWEGHTADSLRVNLDSGIDNDSPADALPADEIPSEPMGLPDVEEMTDALAQLRQVLPEDHPDILPLLVVVSEQVLTSYGVTEGKQHVLVADRNEVGAGERVTHRKGISFQKSAVSGPIDQVLGGHQAVSTHKAEIGVAFLPDARIPRWGPADRRFLKLLPIQEQRVCRDRHHLARGNARIKRDHLLVLDNRVSGKAHLLNARIDRVGQIVPVDQVIADRVPPMLAASGDVRRTGELIRRIRLVEEVPAALPEAQPMRVVHLAFGTDEMISGTIAVGRQPFS